LLGGAQHSLRLGLRVPHHSCPHPWVHPRARQSTPPPVRRATVPSAEVIASWNDIHAPLIGIGERYDVPRGMVSLQPAGRISDV
jgi:hypothetical protein